MAKLTILAVALLLMAGLVIGSTSTSTIPKPSPTTPKPASTTTKPTPTTTKPAPTTTKPAPTTTKPTPTTTKPTTTKPTPTTTKTTTTPTTTKPTTPTTTKTTTPTTTKPTTHPTNTTTHPTNTTTHPTNTTTHPTHPTNTTTHPTTPTTSVTPKPTPPPQKNWAYTVTQGGITCIMFEGSITFMVPYTENTTKGEKNMTATVVSPARPLNGTHINGTCGENQFITFDFGDAKKSRNIILEFPKSKDNKTWSLGVVKASIFLDPETFTDALDANKTLNLVAYYTLNPSTVPVGNSFSCDLTLSTTNVTGMIGNNTYDMQIDSNMAKVKIQAYNMDPKAITFGSPTSCPVKVNNIIPIIVGCSLGGLVVIVLVAYLVGRRKKAANNESTA